MRAIILFMCLVLLPTSLSALEIIDLMVVHTPRATLGIEIDSKIRRIVNYANLSLQNSKIEARINLVHIQQVNYSSTNLNKSLSHLTNRDGIIDEIHDLRDTKGADLVCLVIESDPNFGGIGWILTKMDDPVKQSVLGFNVITSQSSDFVLAHEIGHNLGCAHNKENGLFTDSHGFIMNGYRTVMSISNDKVIPYFSNPDVWFDKQPTGDYIIANNARTISLSAPFVAKYREKREPTSVSVLSYSPMPAKVGEIVKFCISGDETYQLDFGDGVIRDGKGCIEHIYTTTGSHFVKVTNDGEPVSNIMVEVNNVSFKAMTIKMFRGASRKKDVCWMSGRLPSTVIRGDVSVNIGGVYKGLSNKNFRLRGNRFYCRLRGNWGEWQDEILAERFSVYLIINDNVFVATVPVMIRKTKRGFTFKKR